MYHINLVRLMLRCFICGFCKYTKSKIHHPMYGVALLILHIIAN